MRTHALLVAALLAAPLAGCAGTAGGTRNETAGEPEPSGNDEVMRDDTPAQSGTILRVSIDARPEIHIGEEEDLGLRVRVTNEGAAPVSAESLALQLRVDDLPPVQLTMDPRHGWTTLAPGESAEWSNGNRGVRLFEEPGEHTLRLEVGDAVSEPVRVQVSE